MAALALVLLLQDAMETLARTVEFGVEDATLEAFATAAAAAAKTAIAIDPVVYKDVPDADGRVTFSTRDQSLRDALRAVLYPRGLTVTWRDGLVIVPRDRTKPPLETKTYDVAAAIDRLRKRGVPELEDSLERAIVAPLARMAELDPAHAVFLLSPKVAAGGRIVTIETPQIELFRSRQTIIIPSGGSVAASGFANSASSGLGGSGGATTATVHAEVIDIDPDHYYGYGYDDDAAADEGSGGMTLKFTGESLAVVGSTLVARQTPEGHRRIEKVLKEMEAGE